MVFCLFGVLGFCGDRVQRETSQKIQTTAISEFLVDKTSSSLQEMRASGRGVQEIRCVVERGNCIINDVIMKQFAEVTTVGRSNLEKDLSSSATLNRMIDAAAKAALDYSNKANWSNRSVYTSTEQELITYTKTQFKEVLRSETIAKCIADVLARQTIDAHVKEGNVVIKGILMEQTSKVMATCLLEAVVNAASKIENREDIRKKLEEESKVHSSGFLYYGLLIGGGLLALVIIGFVALRLRPAAKTPETSEAPKTPRVSKLKRKIKGTATKKK